MKINFKLISVFFSFICGFAATAEPDPALVKKYFDHISEQQRWLLMVKMVSPIAIDLSKDFDGKNGEILVDSLLVAIKDFPTINLWVEFPVNLGANLLPIIKKLQHGSIGGINFDLSNMGNDGALIVANELENNNNLEALDLSYSQIANDGAIALAKALNKNQKLQRLWLKSNRLGRNGIKALRAALKNNTSLIELDIGLQIPFGDRSGEDKDIEILQEQLRQNKEWLYRAKDDTELWQKSALIILAKETPTNLYSILPDEVILTLVNIVKSLRLKEIKNSIDRE